jgi:hypothetical protein
MEDFANYLISKQFVSKKVSHFYRLWVINLYDYIGKKPGKTLENSDIDRYINYITKSRMEWQVRQAQEAIRLYQYYLERPQNKSTSIKDDIKTQWKTVASETVKILRLKQLALQTERTYMHWLRKFYRFIPDKSPYLIDKTHVISFLTYLAVDCHVAPSTQNQALNSLLFFSDTSLKKILAIFRMLLEQKENPDSRLYSHRTKPDSYCFILMDFNYCWPKFSTAGASD